MWLSWLKYKIIHSLHNLMNGSSISLCYSITTNLSLSFNETFSLGQLGTTSNPDHRTPVSSIITNSLARHLYILLLVSGGCCCWLLTHSSTYLFLTTKDFPCSLQDHSQVIHFFFFGIKIYMEEFSLILYIRSHHKSRLYIFDPSHQRTNTYERRFH